MKNLYARFVLWLIGPALRLAESRAKRPAFAHPVSLEQWLASELDQQRLKDSSVRLLSRDELWPDEIAGIHIEGGKGRSKYRRLCVDEIEKQPTEPSAPQPEADSAVAERAK